MRDIENKLSCKKLFEEYVIKWYSDEIATCTEEQACTNISTLKASPESLKQDPVTSAASKRRLLKGLSQFERLASLLGIQRGELLSFLASLAAKDGNLEEAVYICR